MTLRAWAKATAKLVERYDRWNWSHISDEPRAGPGCAARIIQDLRMQLANLPGVLVADDAKRKTRP